MANLEEAVVATLFDQSDEIADVVTKNHPLLALLDDAGSVRRFSGGYEIRKPVMYNQTAVGGFYSQFESFELDAIDDLTAFRFSIKQAYEPVAISGRDKRANRDEEMLLDLIENKIKAAIARLKNTVSTSIRGDGTGSGGREFDGIAKMIASANTSGTYGTIDRSANSFAQNLKYTVSGGFSSANVQSELTAAMMDGQRDGEGFDFGLLGTTVWKYLHGSLTAIQRITKSDKKALAGFKSINFNGIDYVFDGGFGGGVTTATVGRHLNTKYISWDLVRGMDFKPINGEKMERPIDQDAHFTVIGVEGNLCCSAPGLQQYMG